MRLCLLSTRYHVTYGDYYQVAVSPYHVGRVDVFDIANGLLLCVGVLDGRLHEVADRRQPLVPATVQTAATQIASCGSSANNR